MNIKVLVASAVAAFSSLPVIAQQAPAPCGLVPSARQLEWYNREMIAFFHFGINTFEEYVNEGDGRQVRQFSIPQPWIAGSGCRH